MAGALVVYAFAAMTVTLPFVADADPSAAVFLALWVGGSAFAGAFIPRRWMFAIPVGAFLALMVILVKGYTDSEFLSDSLSSMALLSLAAGELVGLAVGQGLAKAKGSGQSETE